MSGAPLNRGNNRALHATEDNEGPQRGERFVVASEKDWLVVFSGQRSSFVPPTATRRDEIILSSTELLVGTGSALCSIFLFVWALTRLWLCGR